MMLCSLASDSSVPSSGGPAGALSFPNFSRLSAVRELASSSWGGARLAFQDLLGPGAGHGGRGRGEGEGRAAGPGWEAGALAGHG